MGCLKSSCVFNLLLRDSLLSIIYGKNAVGVLENIAALGEMTWPLQSSHWTSFPPFLRLQHAAC
jgi:uncharacterized membrane protein